MIEIKKVTANDREFWFSLDKHLPESEFAHIAELERGYIIVKDDHPVGLFRWNLFWDCIPFLTMIYLEENQRGQGIGREAINFWEHEMRNNGYKAIMTSTQVDEQAQHFYRKLGFLDCGCLVLNLPELAQPMEMFLVKSI